MWLIKQKFYGLLNKKYVLLLSVLFCNLHLAHSQNIESSALDKNEIKNLSNLCKAWGFLKYYHPNVAKGNFNWDEQLLTILPKIEKATSNEAISKVYIDWIDTLGDIRECKSCKDVNAKEYFDKNFNLSWTQNTEAFSNELSKKLKQIENNRFQGKNHYVSTTNIGNISITNEPQYENFEFPNKNYRLLSLFKFWNTIEYFYPYKYLTDQNWNEVLSEMIPKFKNARNATEYHLAMLETVVKVDDSHGIFKTKLTAAFFGTKFFPAKLKIIDNKAIVSGFENDSLCKINDLRIGDIIEKVEDKTINNILKERLKYIPGSNLNVKLRDTYYTIANGNTDSVKISLNRNGIINNKIISRYSFEVLFKKETIAEKYKMLEGNIGYVNMGLVELKDVDKMMEKLMSTKAIIFDIRNYPNFIPYQISRYLNSEKKEFVKITVPDLTYPGKFIWEESITCGNNNNKDYYKGKVIVLVNEQTQSRAEYAVMCLQTAKNVTTIGSQTAGADGKVSKVEFIGGFTSLISGTGIYYPDGSETQRKGITVNIEVVPTMEGIRKGNDEVLEKALELSKL
jgi:carboxyl-terminal processing protease